MDFNAYLGLDVHKNTVAVAIADAGRSGDVRFYGEIGNTPDAVAALLKKLGKRYERMHCVYESGPCGYGLYRQSGTVTPTRLHFFSGRGAITLPCPQAMGGWHAGAGNAAATGRRHHPARCAL
jgi:hypothetical protein